MPPFLYQCDITDDTLHHGLMVSLLKRARDCLLIFKISAESSTDHEGTPTCSGIDEEDWQAAHPATVQIAPPLLFLFCFFFTYSPHCSLRFVTLFGLTTVHRS